MKKLKNPQKNPRILLREREISELNFGANLDWVAGILVAANSANSFNSVSNHKFSLGDSILLKFNLINKKQVRKNPYFRAWPDVAEVPAAELREVDEFLTQLLGIK